MGWPGCSGDSTVFKTTHLSRQLEGRPDSIFLRTDYGIGDQGYSLEYQVLTPFGDPVTPAQHFYNYKHSAARRCVEQVAQHLREFLCACVEVAATYGAVPGVVASYRDRPLEF